MPSGTTALAATNDPAVENDRAMPMRMSISGSMVCFSRLGHPVRLGGPGRP
jgi:hypothetical protein